MPKGIYQRKPCSNETKEKIRRAHLKRKEKLGYVNSPETRERIGKAHKGKKQSLETIKKRFLWQKGYKHSIETKKKIGLANKGKIRTEEFKRKMSERMQEDTRGFKKGHIINKGDKSYLWKGENVGYVGLHLWISKWKGRPRKCEMCGNTHAKKYEWMNINHKYRRVLEDYIRMCTSCHRKFDIKNNNYKFTNDIKKYD